MKVRNILTVLIAIIILSVSAAAFTPTAGNTFISSLNIYYTETVTLTGTCSDADGGANITSCGFDGTVGTTDFDQDGTLGAPNANDVLCTWNGDLNSYAGDVEYRLWCDDGDGKQYGTFNSDNAIKRDPTITLSTQVTAVNFTSSSSANITFRKHYTYVGEDGDGLPANWTHTITASLPTGTTNWKVCEGDTPNCDCPAAEASGTGTSVSWTADTAFDDNNNETLCYTYVERAAFTAAGWSTDANSISNATLQSLGQYLQLVETVGENFRFSYDIFGTITNLTTCTSCSGSNILSSGSSGWTTTAQAGVDWVDQTIENYTTAAEWITNISVTNTSSVKNITVIAHLDDSVNAVHKPNSEFARVKPEGSTFTSIGVSVCADDEDEVETNYTLTQISGVDYYACKKDTDSNGIADYVRIRLGSLPAVAEAGGLLNTQPNLTSAIPNQSWTSGSSATINLANYFNDPDGDALTYISNGTASITVTIAGSTATLTSASGWTGTEYATFTATDGAYNTTSNNVTLTVTAAAAPPGDGGGGGGGGGSSSKKPVNTTYYSKPILKNGEESVTYSTQTTSLTELESIVSSSPELSAALVGDNTLQTTADYGSQLSSSRELKLVNGQPTIVLRITSSSEKTLRNVQVYDTIPKTLATLTDYLDISAPGALKKVIKKDPELLFIYDEFLPDETKTVTYTIKSDRKGLSLEGVGAPISFVGEAEADTAENENVLIPQNNPSSDMVTGNAVLDSGSYTGWLSNLSTNTKLYIGGGIILLIIILLLFFRRKKPATSNPKNLVETILKKANDQAKEKKE